MPSIHIPEDTWAQLLMEHGGDRDAAREAVKDAVAKRAKDD